MRDRARGGLQRVARFGGVVTGYRARRLARRAHLLRLGATELRNEVRAGNEPSANGARAPISVYTELAARADRRANALQRRNKRWTRTAARFYSAGGAEFPDPTRGLGPAPTPVDAMDATARQQLDTAAQKLERGRALRAVVRLVKDRDRFGPLSPQAVRAKMNWTSKSLVDQSHDEARQAPLLYRLREVISSRHGTPLEADPRGRLAGARVVGYEASPNTPANGSLILHVDVAGGRRYRGIFKPRRGEAQWLHRYSGERGGFYRREVAASWLDDALGWGLVPPTEEVTIDGEVGSFQFFAEGATTAHMTDPRQDFDRPRAELLRVFDYLIGHADRHDRNLLFVRQGSRYAPVAIDNGLALLSGKIPRVRSPGTHFDADAHLGPLLPETLQAIAAIDPGRVGRVLRDAGIPFRARREVMRRLEQLRRDPSFLEITPWGRGEGTRQATERTAASDGKGLTLGQRARHWYHAMGGRSPGEVLGGR